MKAIKYLQIKKTGEAQVFAYKPSPLNNSITIRLHLEIPEAVFEQEPYEIKIKVNESTKSTPVEIEIDSNALVDWMEHKK